MQCLIPDIYETTGNLLLITGDMTDDSRRQLFKNFGIENEQNNNAGLYVMIGLAIVAVLILLVGCIEQATQVLA